MHLKNRVPVKIKFRVVAVGECRAAAVFQSIVEVLRLIQFPARRLQKFYGRPGLLIGDQHIDIRHRAYGKIAVNQHRQRNPFHQDIGNAMFVKKLNDLPCFKKQQLVF